MTTPLKPSPIRLVTHSDGSLHPHHMQGWKRDAEDPRDLKISAHDGHRLLTAPAALPSKVDLRAKESPIRDQGQLGSCTAHGVSAPVEMNELQYDSHVLKQMSTLFQYQVSLIDQGVFPQDNGDSIRGAVKSLVKHGALLENEYPYIINNLPKKPSAKLQKTAATRKVASYHRIADGDLHTMKAVLASGYLIVFGFEVPASFETQEFASDPILRLEAVKDEEIVGGHCVCLDSFDDSTGLFGIRNSWGKSWAQGGRCFFDYAFIGDKTRASDYWLIESAPL